jgi:predicted  nucleic acid-binding Zn-ribbon protein
MSSAPNGYAAAKGGELPMALPAEKLAKAPRKKKEAPVNAVAPAGQEPAELATVEQQLEQHALNVEAIQGKAVFEIGRELKAAQEVFRFRRDEKGFTGWLAARLPHINQRAAYRAIQQFEAVEKFDEFVKLSGSAREEAATAEPDIQALIAERVEAGEVFTAAQVKALKEEASRKEREAAAAIADLKAQVEANPDQVEGEAPKGLHGPELAKALSDARAEAEKEAEDRLAAELNAANEKEEAARKEAERLQAEIDKLKAKPVDTRTTAEKERDAIQAVYDKAGAEGQRLFRERNGFTVDPFPNEERREVSASPTPPTATEASRADDVPPVSTETAAKPSDLPEPLIKGKFILRPWCLKGDGAKDCAGSGSQHCHSCLRAAGLTQEHGGKVRRASGEAAA